MSLASNSQQLLDRMVAGDDGALDQLLDMHLPGLRAFVRLRTGKEIRRKESASDVVQSVCREILQHKERFKHPGEKAFKQWLYLTAIRKLSNKAEHWRAAKRDQGREVRAPQSSPNPSSGDDDLLQAYGTICTPSRELMAREGVSNIEAAFDQLPDDQREVICLSRLVGLSHSEIAEQMGRSEGATRQLLFRALARLAEALDIER